jgi:hypothetical protein
MSMDGRRDAEDYIAAEENGETNPVAASAAAAGAL